MFLSYLLFSSFCFDLSLARRANKINFNSNIHKRSIEDSWYFVKMNFNKNDTSIHIDKVKSELRNQGIFLDSSNYVSKNVYNLFLTPVQVNFILSHNYGEIHELQNDNKLTNSPNYNWTILTIEVSDSLSVISDFSDKFSDNKCKFKFSLTTKNTFSVNGEKKCLYSIVNDLIQDKRVYAVSYDNEPEELNSRVSGFIQKNTYNATSIMNDIDESHIVDVNRFLNDQGLDGTGIVILVADTYLDTNSTFFYDPNCPNVELNKLIPNHRKIIYHSAQGNETYYNAEHGTHTAGTAVGRALNDSSPISKYNGVAYGSKLAYYASNNQGLKLDLIAKTIDIVKPHISSNSWGIDGKTIINDKSWNEVALKYNDTLLIFAAGNSGIIKKELNGFETLRSPGSAKNILTVGAVEPVSIDEEEFGTDNRDIFLLESSDKYTKMKLLEWSIEDLETNIGYNNLFNSAKIQVTFTRDQTSIKNTTVLVIDDIDQFNNISKENPPYFVASTSEFEIENFTQLGFKHTFPVMYLPNSSIPEYPSDLIANYRTNKTYHRAEFSSQGTGNLGIMKPDIMCPGVNIFSAESIVNGTADHDDLAIKYGTSMATPACAGASALVYQYFLEGRYKKTPYNISSQLARSFMINCANSLTTIYPNTINGYGVLNLGNYIGNGEETDNSRILISDHNKISEDHLMTNISLTKTSDVDFKITLSYLDATLSADSSSALVVDIDLVVISPSGIVYRGNQRQDNTEEHYSTNERIIIKSNEIEEGDYEIHVLTSIPKNHNELRDLIEFSVTIFGPLSSKSSEKVFLQFEKATKCIPMDEKFTGDCNEETTMNDCYDGRYGRSCQKEAFEYYPDIPREIYNIGPLGVSYILIKYPFERFSQITYRIIPSSLFEPKIAVFMKTNKDGMEVDADTVSISGGYSLTIQSSDSSFDDDNVALFMVYNTSPFPVDFIVTSEISEPTSKPTTKPTIVPTSEPTTVPTSEPTTVPTSEPTTVPTSKPTTVPTSEPTTVPTSEPTTVPTSEPTTGPSSSSSDSNSNTVSKKSFVIVSVFAIVFGFITIVLAIVIIVAMFKKNKKDLDSNLAMASLSKSLL